MGQCSITGSFHHKIKEAQTGGRSKRAMPGSLVIRGSSYVNLKCFPDDPKKANSKRQVVRNTGIPPRH